jgi:bifunctional pyridoxal-dependent enzyme with beta-cystathionase and maltose regulon repressor activities
VTSIAETAEDTTVATRIGKTTNVYTCKTKYMIIPNRKKKANEIERNKINGHRHKNLEIFKYLSSLVTYTNAAEAEIKGKNSCW